MNKKLTTILLAVLIILIGKVDAATLTQKIGEGYIRSTVVEGQEVTIRFVSNKYTFSSWTVESGNVNIDTTNPVVTFTMPSSNVVIKANYEGETVNYTISYNANGGTGSMTAQTVVAGQSVTLSTNTFIRSGYTFKGWSTNSSATTATYTDGQSITPTTNMTLYAVWESEITGYTLTYNANSGSGAPESQTGTTLTISSTTPTRSGWDFVGWGTSSSSTSATYQAGDSITLTADTTLYAIWNKTLTLTYSANGGSGGPSSQSITTTSSSATFTISTIEPTPPSGKAFRGWENGISKKTYKIGSSISISSNIYLYALYTTPLSIGDSFAEVDVGAYVTYTPSSTSCTVSTTASGYASSQNFNPSTVTNWRVFSNDGTNVEIISDESVGDLYLTGSTGYVNVVQTLQDMTAAYVNSTYATSARSLGYSEDGLTSAQIENYKVIDTDTYPVEYGVEDTFPYSDTQYSSDETIINNNGMLKQNGGGVWCASRSFSTITTSSFGVLLNDSGSSSRSATLYYGSSGNMYSSTHSNGVRPVVSLKSGLTISGGDGSPSNPYVLE